MARNRWIDHPWTPLLLFPYELWDSGHTGRRRSARGERAPGALAGWKLCCSSSHGERRQRSDHEDTVPRILLQLGGIYPDRRGGSRGVHAALSHSGEEQCRLCSFSTAACRAVSEVIASIIGSIKGIHKRAGFSGAPKCTRKLWRCHPWWHFLRGPRRRTHFHLGGRWNWDSTRRFK